MIESLLKLRLSVIVLVSLITVVWRRATYSSTTKYFPDK